MSAKNTASGRKAIQPLNDTAFPLISVIILTYKDQDAVYRTLDTVFRQDYPNLELIVSDDASGEQDRQQIEDYIMRHKRGNLSVFKVIRNESNLGTVAHANKAARISKGTFVKFLSCGDGFYSDHAVTQLYEFAAACPQPVVTSVSAVCSRDFHKTYYLYPSKRHVRMLRQTKPEKLFSKLAVLNKVSAVGALFRRRFFDEGGFDERYRYLEDWPLWLKLTRAGMPVPCLEAVTTYYAVGGISSKSGNAYASPLLLDDMIRCYELEILPYIKRISKFKRYMITYRYKRLTGNEGRSLPQKIAFTAYYLPPVLFYFMKKLMKSLYVKLKGDQR